MSLGTRTIGNHSSEASGEVEKMFGLKPAAELVLAGGFTDEELIAVLSKETGRR